MHPKLRKILRALKEDGVEVSVVSSGSPANADSYEFSATFDDGGLSVETGNYWFAPRGGTVEGPLALQRLLRLLKLRLTARTARAWGIQIGSGGADHRRE
jgi:hypothetical protein